VGVFAGPKVVEDGLVLSLDLGNIFKSVDSTSNNFLQNGSFAGGLGVTYEEGSNPTNTIVELENPGDSNYVLRQNGNNTEYQMNIDGGAQGTLSASTQYVMSGWYATSDDYNGGDTMFHARAFSTGGSHISTGTGIGTLLYSVEIGGLTWEYRYQTITTPSDYSGDFDWYLGYGTTNTTGYRYYTGLKVEQGSFPSLLDLSRNGNDAKVINGTSYSSANGGSLVFDGTDDTVNFEYDLRSNWTYECWVNKDAKGGFSFLGQGTTSSGSGLHIVMSNDKLRFGMYANDTDALGLYSNTSTGVWYHYAFTYNHSTFLKQIYRNGVQLTGTPVQTQTAYIGTGTVRIGASYSSGGTVADGKIASSKLYNRVLTASEIKQNFNATRGRFGI
jgi:hypothetical protein